jgi:hypothetical protein
MFPLPFVELGAGFTTYASIVFLTDRRRQPGCRLADYGNKPIAIVTQPA